MPPADWEQRATELWARLDDIEPDAFRQAVDALAAELPDGDPAAAFERACAFDSTGHSDRAVPLYRQAIAGGVTGIRRRRAVIQLASSLRNVVAGRRGGRRGPARRCGASSASWMTARRRRMPVTPPASACR